MALGDPYATPEDLEGRLGTAEPVVGLYYRLIDAASRAVEAFTRRQFNRTNTASARRYRAIDYERVAVDDFHTLTDLEVEVDGVAWDVDTYVDARPWSDIIIGPINMPYADLFAINRCWPQSRRALITVTARWGWQSVPSGIVEATLDVAQMMYLKTSLQAGAVRSETISGFSVSWGAPNGQGSSSADVPPEMVNALPFRRKRFGVA